MPFQDSSILPKIGTVISVIGNESDQKVRVHSRIVVLGGSKVGKTAIVQQFLYGSFPDVYSATVDEVHRTEFEVKGMGTLTLDILDTSGSYEFPAMQRLAISKADAFILVHSIDDPNSFEEIRRLRDLIFQLKCSSESSSLSHHSYHSQPTNLRNRLRGVQENPCGYRG